MLKQRLVTAVLLIPLVVWALLALPTYVVQGLVAAVAMLAGWEWLQIIGLKSPYKLFTLVFMAVLAWLVFMYLPTWSLLTVSVLIWLAATALVVRYAHSPFPGSVASLFTEKPFGVLVASLILLCFTGSASVIHASVNQGPLLLLFVLVSVWLADTGGYFAGKRFGKHKLATVISPNKTWEGVLGALVLSVIWAIAFFFIFDSVTLSLPVWLAVTVVTVLISVVGDLFESVFKRCFHVKDSGQLLPGHGGMLDRVDSLMSAVPVFAAIMFVLGVL